MITFKSDIEKTLELIQEGNVKNIKTCLNTIFTRTSKNSDLVDINNMGEILLELVKNNSNDFTKDISTKCLDNQYNLSDKQSWCISYQIVNNLELYILSMKEYIKECSEETETETFETFVIADTTSNTDRIYIDCNGENCELEENAMIFETEKEAEEYIKTSEWSEWASVTNSDLKANM